MIKIRIEKKGSFTVSGVKTWISGQNNDQFAAFWKYCHESGIIERLKHVSKNPETNVTHSSIFGVSRVEKDPDDRAFFFYIVSESDHADDCETFEISAGEWAVFEGDGDTPMALINAEMEAFMRWLPNSDYTHDFRPELEVYPSGTGVYAEFWLPIRQK